MKTLFILLLSINLCFAQNVKVVKKGEIVPFDGVLFTKEMEKGIREETERLVKSNEALTKIKQNNEKEIEVLNKRVNLYEDRVKEMADREVKAERDGKIKNILYFVSGVVLTGLITYGVSQVNR